MSSTTLSSMVSTFNFFSRRWLDFICFRILVLSLWPFPQTVQFQQVLLFESVVFSINSFAFSSKLFAFACISSISSDSPRQLSFCKKSPGSISFMSSSVWLNFCFFSLQSPTRETSRTTERDPSHPHGQICPGLAENGLENLPCPSSLLLGVLVTLLPKVIIVIIFIALFCIVVV